MISGIELGFWKLFQSTPSRRGRRVISNKRSIRILFQSTPSRRGRPSSEIFSARPVRVSIHSLTQRETLLLDITPEGDEFQSTPSRRGRLTADLERQLREMFQSTPSRRGRLYKIKKPKVTQTFQSTPSRRGRRV